MTPLLLTGIFAFAALLLICIALTRPYDIIDDGPKALAIFAAAICVFPAILIPLVIYTSRPLGHTSCLRFHKQTGYPTKFVLLNSWDTGTCLARTRSGRWVPTKQLVGVSR